MIVTVSRWLVRRLISCLLMAALATLVGGDLTNASAKTRPEIRLVLQITIDGLRADLINRYEKGFAKGGFRWNCPGSVQQQAFSATNQSFAAQVRNNYHDYRSGDIYIIQEPYWFLFDKQGTGHSHARLTVAL